MFSDVYQNKTVLITGHTGFKGSWLASWLIQLGARVVGYSAYLPSDPCYFSACNLQKYLDHHEGDVRDFNHLKQIFEKYKPDILFHLAAQPIVTISYQSPKETFDTNAGGTLNVLECMRQVQTVKAAVIITSDKCYQNVEWAWGYRENDKLGGDDPYSASKACAEMIAHSYIKTFCESGNLKTNISTARAGNVIGGGDWAAARIIPDCVRAWIKGEVAKIRNPISTRPWQHVLEPLSGYLWLGANLINNNCVGESFNFGPDSRINKSVEDLIKVFLKEWGEDVRVENCEDKQKKECGLLKLSCDKALHQLNWHAVLDFENTVRFTSEWYQRFYNTAQDMLAFSIEQINQYVQQARTQKLNWSL